MHSAVQCWRTGLNNGEDNDTDDEDDAEEDGEDQDAWLDGLDAHDAGEAVSGDKATPTTWNAVSPSSHSAAPASFFLRLRLSNVAASACWKRTSCSSRYPGHGTPYLMHLWH